MQVSIGSSAPVVATLSNANNEAITTGPPIKWTSNDTLIARVSPSGVITGVKLGSTLITASAGKKSQTVQVGVLAQSVAEVALSTRKLTLGVGSTAIVRATAKDANGRPLARDAMWISSDAAVATVGGGRVTAKAPGTATITAQIESKSATADIEVLAPKIGDTVKTGVQDCVAYEPASIAKPSKDKVVGWRVTDGCAVIATLDNESEAEQVIALARRYKGHCFIGRGNTRSNHSDYVVDYWIAPTNVPSTIQKEDCREYDRGSLTMKDLGAAGVSVEDRNWRLSLADNKPTQRRSGTSRKSTSHSASSRETTLARIAATIWFSTGSSHTRRAYGRPTWTNAHHAPKPAAANAAAAGHGVSGRLPSPRRSASRGRGVRRVGRNLRDRRGGERRDRVPGAASIVDAARGMRLVQAGGYVDVLGVIGEGGALGEDLVRIAARRSAPACASAETVARISPRFR